ncbi:DUF7344 domain-containing protein [Halobiforma nitratireducens]|uniref:DUF7344 domain-containing protein n=1 Tax=Halobiforma nitratireducens JCM 10879 TaxID=1227454 RepID=M0LY91_9EURY|nr:hypothetical protein [Halobiforma nitratireducens]EMA37329.1 hypothetical protein C446_10750 [Halobiforma nitratireducens JCM 10879]
MSDWPAPDDHSAHTETSALRTGDLFRLLSSRRARATVVVLRDQPDTTLDRLASAVATMDAGDPSTPPEREYDRVRHELYHATLPALEEQGLIAFDPDRKTVRVTDVPEAVYAVVEELDE